MDFEDYINELENINKEFQDSGLHLTYNENGKPFKLQDYKKLIGYIRPDHPLQDNEVKLKNGFVGDLI